MTAPTTVGHRAGKNWDLTGYRPVPVWLRPTALALVFGLSGCGDEAITSGFANSPEVYREDVGFDVYFCMRVAASPAEVDRFVSRVFSDSERVAVPADDFLEKSCLAAAFWPREFSDPTVAYKPRSVASRLEESSGAVVQDGYLYFWEIGL